MKRFLSIATLVFLVTFFLSAGSLPAGAASKGTSMNGQAAQQHSGLNAGGMRNVAASTNLRGIGEFYGVAAVSANDIWAVGDGLGTLVEHWNGTQWSLVKSLSPGMTYNHLYGVAAVSTNDVWAVGSYSNDRLNPNLKTLIEHWNGSQWSIVSSPSPGTTTNILYSVTAISSSDVWAVGNYDASTLIEHWNGTQWSVVSSPTPNNNAVLNGVTAVTSSNVWAVGYTFGTGVSQSGSSGSQTLIEQWNGSAWSVIASPNSGASYNYLTGVAAISASDIWAVGYDNNNSTTQTLIEQWNGSAWSIVSSPNPGSSSDILNSVAAVSANNVWAVGNEESGTSSGRTLVEQWNGTQWSVVSSPNVGTQTNTLHGVAALSTSQVWSVGVAVYNAPYKTLTERWNGTTWSVVPSPNQVGNGSLAGVAVVTASDMWAVGSDDGGALTEHWDGTKWSFITSPNPGSGVNSLNAVAAVSTSDVWAVGFYSTYNGIQHTLIEQWNGTQWSIIPSPNSGSQFNFLYGVSIVSSSNIWAVGSYENSGSIAQTLIEHWNGSAWSIVSSPSPGVSGNTLNAVAAVSASDVWAVGAQYNASGIRQTLIEQWNGSAWSIVSSPNPGSSLNELTGVTAVSASDVWAVGDYNGASGSQTLTEQWNGSTWSVVTSPNATSSSSLLGVATASAGDVWAVGTSLEPSGVYQTLIEHWNGSTWSIVTSPNPGSIENILNAVAVVSASNAWAVGLYANNQYATQSLVERWNGSAWSVVSSPNVATHFAG